jgi:hypothetical protein
MRDAFWGKAECSSPRWPLCAQLFFPTVIAYMVVSFIQGGAGTGGSGMLNNLRSYLWIPIAQNAYRLPARASQQSQQ